MKLMNFSLRDKPTTVTLVEGEREWELHNYATFESAEYRPLDDILLLTWGIVDGSVPNGINPWGSANNPYRGCAISFEGVQYFQMLDGGLGSGVDENGTLAFAAWVSPPSPGDPVPADLRIKEADHDIGAAHLFLKLQSGRSIEIGADRASLSPLSEESKT